MLASAGEVTADFPVPIGKCIVCLVALSRPIDDRVFDAIEAALNRGCDYFALYGPHAAKAHEQIDALIESRATAGVHGGDEVPPHATTAEVEGAPEEAAAIFLHSAGAQVSRRGDAVWLAIIELEDLAGRQLKEALSSEAGA